MSKLKDSRKTDLSRRVRLKMLFLFCFWSLGFPLANAIYRVPPAVFEVVGLVYLALGVWISEYEQPKKAVALFLRRFSNQASGSIISRAVALSLGSYYRLITLAGGDPLPHAGVPRIYGGCSALIREMPCVMFAYGTGFALAIKLNPASLHGEEWVDWLVQCTITLFTLVPIFGIRYILFRRRLKVVKQEHLKRLEERIHEWTSPWMRGSQLVGSMITVTAAEATWRSAVVLLADKAAAVVVDVSVPSRHLAWEIEALEPSCSDKTILIASLGQLATIRSNASVSHDPSACWWLEVIGNREIIPYTTGKDGDDKVFAERLLTKIDDIFSRMSESRPSVADPERSVSLRRMLQIAGMLGCFGLFITIMIPEFRRATQDKAKEDEVLADSYRKQNPKAIIGIDIFDYSGERLLKHIDDPLSIEGFVSAFADLKPASSDSAGGFSRFWIIKISGSETRRFDVVEWDWRKWVLVRGVSTRSGMIWETSGMSSVLLKLWLDANVPQVASTPQP